ncbi:14575_t:CDS:2, partial [Gigaspora margarita]
MKYNQGLLSNLIFTSEVYDMSLQYNYNSLENYIDLNKFYNDNDDSLDCDNLEYYKKNNIQLLASLEVEMLFDNFDYAERFLNQYAKDNGSRKSKKVVDIVQQKDLVLEKIDCPWVYNINKIKDKKTVKVTSFVNQYNYICNDNMVQYALKYRCFSSEVLDDIRFFTVDGQMGAKIQYYLLVAKYKDIYIYKKDLYNAIYHFKATLAH